MPGERLSVVRECLGRKSFQHRGVDTERKARVYPLYLALLLLPLKTGRRARPGPPSAYYAGAYACITKRRIHRRPAPRRLHKQGGAAGQGGWAHGQAPARERSARERRDAGADVTLAGGTALAAQRAPTGQRDGR